MFVVLVLKRKYINVSMCACVATLFYTDATSSNGNDLMADTPLVEGACNTILPRTRYFLIAKNVNSYNFLILLLLSEKFKKIHHVPNML